MSAIVARLSGIALVAYLALPASALPAYSSKAGASDSAFSGAAVTLSPLPAPKGDSGTTNDMLVQVVVEPPEAPQAVQKPADFESGERVTPPPAPPAPGTGQPPAGPKDDADHSPGPVRSPRISAEMLEITLAGALVIGICLAV